MNFEVTVTVEDLGGKTRLHMQMLFPSAKAGEFTVKKYAAIEGLNQTPGRLEEHLRKCESDPPWARRFGRAQALTLNARERESLLERAGARAADRNRAGLAAINSRCRLSANIRHSRPLLPVWVLTEFTLVTK